jgi:hypothetical protein
MLQAVSNASALVENGCDGVQLTSFVGGREARTMTTLDSVKSGFSRLVAANQPKNTARELHGLRFDHVR